MPENEQATPQVPMGQIALVPQQDGSAIAQLTILGVYLTQILIPRPVVEQFIKDYKQVLMSQQDILRLVKSSRND